MKRIRKAVFPVAGLGTRFLPATKAMPKEMLPVVDRPLIQHVVDEAREAGIEHFIFVTGRNKGVIEDHFDRQFELELTLRERGKRAELEVLARDLPEAGQTSFTRQQSPLGLGHAVWCARELIGSEPFALLLPDVLVQSPRGCLAQMMDVYATLDGRANIIAVEEIPRERVHMYGVVGVGKAHGKAFAITEMVEKPSRAEAPSNLIITGRYILQPEIFALLETQQRGAGGEILINLNWNQNPKKQDGGFFSKLLGGGGGKGIDLDLGCLFEMVGDIKGAIQPLGKAFGAFDRPPYINHLGDDRTGAWSEGENMKINLAYTAMLKRVLVFTYIYEGVPDWSATDGVVTVKVPGQPVIEVPMGSQMDKRALCAIAMLDFDSGNIKVTKLVTFHNDQRDCDAAYRWGMKWVAGSKD